VWLQQRRVSDDDNFLHDDSLAADADMTFSWRRLYHRVKLMLLGHSDTLPRTANLVQVLGNMTVMIYAVNICFFFHRKLI